MTELPGNFIEQFEREGYFAFRDFIAPAVTERIRSELLSLKNARAFRRAGIGKDDNFQVNEEQRGDFIHWIDPSSTQEGTRIFLDGLEGLVRGLNRLFYLGIRDYECHYTEYPAGTFYKKHVDRHKGGSPRVVSFVFYLNETWTAADGGQLRIYGETGYHNDILPAAGTLALFLSEKEHEVLTTHRARMSITGWMLDQSKP